MNQNELYHHGIKGMHWGIRRYQNPDGTLTAKGKQRYGTVENLNAARSRNRRIAKRVAIGAGIAGAGLAAYYGGKAAWKNPRIRQKLTASYYKLTGKKSPLQEKIDTGINNFNDKASAFGQKVRYTRSQGLKNEAIARRQKALSETKATIERAKDTVNDVRDALKNTAKSIPNTVRSSINAKQAEAKKLSDFVAKRTEAGLSKAQTAYRNAQSAKKTFSSAVKDAPNRGLTALDKWYKTVSEKAYNRRADNDWYWDEVRRMKNR